tara:strand:+ start:663 stop:866 length:204 start_codon:yes stop_codon:yes gene_type:complete
MRDFYKYPATFDEKLRMWLSIEERSMSWLARKCNVSPASVKGWTEARHKPSKKHRIMIQDITGIDYK